MSRLSRYILVEVAPPVLIATAFFTMIMVLVQMLRLTSLMLRAGVGFGVLAEVVAMMAVTLLAMTLPMGILLGTLIGIGRLAAENEMLAIRAAGINPLRVMMPLVVAAGLVAGALMVVNVEVIPRFFERIYSIRVRLQHDLLTNLQPGTVYDDLGTRSNPLALFYESRGTPESDDVLLPMERVNLRGRVPDPGVDPDAIEPGSRAGLALEFMVSARQGAVLRDPETGYLDLRLTDGTFLPLDEIERGGGTTSVVRFGELRTSFSSRALESAGALAPRAMRQEQLREALANPPHVEKKREDGRLHREWMRYYTIRNELIQRFTMPLATIVFVLIAIPIAMEARSTARSLSVLIAGGLLLAYYILMSAGQSIGSSGAAMPLTVFGHLLPVAVVGSVGLWMLYRSSRR